MIDPGALGTLHIGLEAARRAADLDAPRPVRRRASRPPLFPSLRLALAGALRTAAARVEPAC